jgi:hypothetical protein
VTESSAKLLCAAVGAAALVCLSGCGQNSGPAAPTTHSDPEGPSGEIDFADRITHIWTNTKNYLVAIHLEGRSGTRGWSATKSALTQDFAVVIP